MKALFAMIAGSIRARPAAMAHENPNAEALRALLVQAKTIAVVGASANPARPSHGVMGKLLAAGYQVIPVNPNESEVLGQKVYPSLSAVPSPIDIVNVFRRPQHTLALADEAARAGAKVLWLQSGIVNEETARRASTRGLSVVMDLCIGVEHALLRVPKKA